MVTVLMIIAFVVLVLALYAAQLWLGRPEKKRFTEWDDSTQIHEWKMDVRGRS